MKEKNIVFSSLSSICPVLKRGVIEMLRRYYDETDNFFNRCFGALIPHRCPKRYGAQSHINISSSDEDIGGLPLITPPS